MTEPADFGISKRVPEPVMPPLVFFDTKTQRTRLVTEPAGCFIELSDKETNETKQYKVTGSDVSVNPSYKDRVGLVDIGDRKDWLYSKRLFLDENELEKQVRIRLESTNQL